MATKRDRPPTIDELRAEIEEERIARAKAMGAKIRACLDELDKRHAERRAEARERHRGRNGGGERSAISDQET